MGRNDIYEISKTENRNLNVFQPFTLEDFIVGNYQDNFEMALSDQLLGSEQIRTIYKQTLSHLSKLGVEESICHNRYLELESNTERRRGIFNCEDYIIYLPEPLTDEQKEILENNFDKYNHLNKLSEVYYYFVDDPSSFNFEKNERIIDYPRMLKEKLKGEKGLGFLEYDDFEGYKKYFYKTDHHWDYRGSYQGFIDIAKMLNIEKPIKPAGIFTNHENFFGSYARGVNNYDFKEEFKFYDFAIPAHETYINDEKSKYNHFEEYKDHEYKYEKTENYYAYVYGDDYGEIVFDFQKPEKDNLLIISNSYSNALNELVAQYFNKTYVVDLRHFRKDMGEDFVLEKYLKEKKIDKVLVLMSPTFIRAEEPNRGLEL